MLTVRLDPELGARFSELAEATGRSKRHHVRQASQRGSVTSTPPTSSA